MSASHKHILLALGRLISEAANRGGWVGACLMAIRNPWFEDLPRSFQTEERRWIKISSEALHSAEMICENGAAHTRLAQLRRDEADLLPVWQQSHQCLEMWNKMMKYANADPNVPATEYQRICSRYGLEERKESTQLNHLNYLREVIWFLESHLGLPLSRSPIPTSSRSGGLVKEDLVA